MYRWIGEQSSTHTKHGGTDTESEDGSEWDQLGRDYPSSQPYTFGG